MSKAKATKKFEKRHLKEVLKRRNSVSKIKKSKQRKEKKKARAHRDESPPRKDNTLLPGGVDDFFQSGFELPERVKTKRKAAPSSSSVTVSKRAKLHHETSGSDDNQSFSLEDQPTGGTIDAVDASDEEAGVVDEEDHKIQLQALEEKDPEFYKYLKENDEELLEFESDDLAEIDLISDNDTSSPQQVKSGKESDSKEKTVDTELIERWRTALVGSNSLRSTRELVLAFRAAVHASEESQIKYKYTMQSSEGKFSHLTMLSLKNARSIQ
jgi:nucleolar complex protein 2